MATTLTPAYGRDYKTAKEVKAAWDAQKDFIIADFFSPYDGKPMNKQQARPGETFNIRFKGKTQMTQVKGGATKSNPRKYKRTRRNPKHHKRHWSDAVQLKIARQTLKLTDFGARIFGGPTKAEARATIKRLTGRTPKDNPRKYSRRRKLVSRYVKRNPLSLGDKYKKAKAIAKAAGDKYQREHPGATKSDPRNVWSTEAAYMARRAFAKACRDLKIDSVAPLPGGRH